MADGIPGTPGNGHQQVLQIQPIVVQMQGCHVHVTFEGSGPERVTVLTFVHMSGVIAYQTKLTDDGRAALARELTGGVLIPQIGI